LPRAAPAAAPAEEPGAAAVAAEEGEEGAGSLAFVAPPAGAAAAAPAPGIAEWRVATAAREARATRRTDALRREVAQGAVPFRASDFDARAGWRRLGGGAYGTVFSAFSIVDNRRVALKVFLLKDFASVANELRALRHLEAVRVATGRTCAQWPVMCFDRLYVDPTTDSYLLQSEDLVALGYVPMQVLIERDAARADTKRRQENEGEEEEEGEEAAAPRVYAPLAVPERLRIAQNAIEAVRQLHAMRVVHRDLKPDNLLVQLATQHVKLIDFGESCFECPAAARRQVVGSPLTIAPELFAPLLPLPRAGQSVGYTPTPSELAASDWWSLGITELWYLSGRTPADLFYASQLAAPSAAELAAAVADDLRAVEGVAAASPVDENERDADDADERREWVRADADERRERLLRRWQAQENGTGITAEMWRDADRYLEAHVDARIRAFIRRTVRPMLRRLPTGARMPPPPPAEP
jgi:hypothetical protein